MAQTTVNALGHSHNAVVTEPTCTEQGYTTHTCHCGDTYKDTYTDALGHSFGDWIIVKEPTDDEEGLKERYCECGEKESLSLPNLSPSLEFTLNEDKSSYSVTDIGTYKDTNVIIPSIYNGLPVTSIGNNAFLRCTNLTSVTIPNSVTSIGAGAFAVCTSLEDIVIPNSVTSIGMEAFVRCTSLKSIVIPISVKTILIDVFVGCDKLTIYCEATSKPSGWSSNWNSSSCPVVWGYIDWSGEFEYSVNGDSVTIDKYIGTNTKVTIPSSIDGLPVTSIGGGAFSSCTNLTSITIPDSITSINCSFYWCTSLTSIVVDENNQHYKSIDGNLYTKDEKTLIQYAIGKTDTKFTIPEGVTYIDGDSFANCSNLGEVYISNGVITIGSDAFSNCQGLDYVYIPDSVTTIGNGAFIGSPLPSIRIGSGVTYIGSHAFYNSGNLHIYYNGTAEDWGKITKSSPLCYSGYTVYCANGDVITE